MPSERTQRPRGAKAQARDRISEENGMSKKATEFQKREMSRMYRGKEIFKPLNTGWIDGHVACVREWVQTSSSIARAAPPS